jgi:uncharacterized membrane protein YccC
LAWFKHLVHINPAKVSGRDIVRVTASIVTPLAAALALEDVAGRERALSAGVLATLGALVGAIAPQEGPLREKLGRTAAGVVLGALGIGVGQYAAGGGWQPVVVLAALAAVAALISGIGANISFGSLQFLIYIAVGSGLKSSLPDAVRTGFFFVGGSWATLLTLLEAATNRADPDQSAVGAVFAALARLLATSGTGASNAARAAVTEAYNRAYGQVVDSRSHAAGTSARLVRLSGVLNSTAPLVEGAVALTRSSEKADPKDVAAVNELAAAVSAGRLVSGPPPPSLDRGSPAARGVRRGTRVAWDVVGGNESAGANVVAARDRPMWLEDLASRTVANPGMQLFALRLALCMGIAEIVRQNLPYQRPYWVLLTVAIVLKPDFGSVFARGVQRTFGS